MNANTSRSLRSGVVLRQSLQSFLNFDELLVDNFCGGGGASEGIEEATDRYVDIAVNHTFDAIRMHEVNHPHTRHFNESVWDINPLEVTRGRPVGLAWFSPDCTHFSKARGAVPVKKEIRGLAWVAVRWAATVRPRIIMLENVEEFTTWGPVVLDGEGNAYPCPNRKGETFNSFIRQLTDLGYKVEHRELRACDYGAPTIRKRLFLIARCDGQPIVWPDPTHGPGKLPYLSAASCIDFSLPCPSIFLSTEEGKKVGVRRPLADATLRRIADGTMRYVVNHEDPFLVPDGMVVPFLTEHANASKQRNMSVEDPLRTVCAGVKGGHFALVSAFLAKHYTGVVGADARDPMPTVTAVDHNSLVAASLVHVGHGEQTKAGAKRWSDGTRNIRDPLNTITASGSPAGLVTSHLIKMRNNCDAKDMRDPLDTITASGGHFGEVRAFLMKFYSSGGQWQDVRDPMHTITGNDRMGLVMVHGEPYAIVDIGMRMLTPRELYRAQGFPEDYIIDRDIEGRPFTKRAQVERCGNSVSPKVAAALVRANYSTGVREKEAA